MGRQGRYLSQQQIERIVWLLSVTDLSFIEIAQRMSCTKATIAAINRKCKVRQYGGLKRSWVVERVLVHHGEE